MHSNVFSTLGMVTGYFENSETPQEALPFIILVPKGQNRERVPRNIPVLEMCKRMEYLYPCLVFFSNPYVRPFRKGDGRFDRDRRQGKGGGGGRGGGGGFRGGGGGGGKNRSGWYKVTVRITSVTTGHP